VRWDLSDVAESLEDEHVEPLLEAVDEHAARVEKAEDRLDELERDDLERLLDELGEMREATRRLVYAGSLRFSLDTSDDEARTFLERARQTSTEAANRTRFLTHWIKGLDDERADELTPEDPELAYYVRNLRRFSPYRLPEEVERVVADKDQAGIGAVKQAREILTSSFTFTDPETGEEVPRDELKQHVYSADREVRRAAYDELLSTYQESASVLTHLYRSIVRDWHVENLTHRGYPRPMTPRNLANEVTDEVVDTVLEVCRDRRELWHRFFAWKRDRIGEPFDRRDVYAPLEEDVLEVEFDEARETVLAVHEGFHEDVAAATREVFDASHVDAFPREGKRGGAFCATPQTDGTPYVLLNHTPDARSAFTMAHELGHAAHSVLARERHPLVSKAPLPLAETASVFSELLLYDHLVTEHPDAAQALTEQRVTGFYGTIQRQAYFALFEQRAHELVPEGAPTSALDEAYAELLEEQFGPIEVPEAFHREWLTIPHFNASPFYVPAYSFGALLSLSLFQRYREDEAFADSVLAILSASGSRDPAELLADHGVDVEDPAFWNGGLDVVEDMVDDLGA
jgi:oligoendopeptidase F